MLADSVPTASLAILTPGVLSANEAKHRLLDFVAEQLSLWKATESEMREDAEDRLTARLSEHLNEAANLSDAWSAVHFQTQVPDALDRTRTLDIAAKPIKTVIIVERPYTRRAVLLPIECKRLPAPRSARGAQEYVKSSTGTTGGIQRFKLGKHAGDHNLAAMIGYVQKGQPVDWFATVNGWITTLASASESDWTNDDCLALDVDYGELCRLISHHDRGAGKGKIELRHLWIDLN